MSLPTSPDAGSRRAVLILASVVAAAVLYGVANWTGPGQATDSTLMAVGLGLTELGFPLEPLRVARTLSVALVGVVVSVGLVVAAARRRWASAVRGGLLVALTAAGAMLLRTFLPRPWLGDDTYPFNTWPSVHAATATALVLAGAGLLPPSARTSATRRGLVVLIGALGALSIVTLAHRPSDVVCSILLAGAFARLVLPPAAPADGPGEAGAGIAPADAVPLWQLGLLAVSATILTVAFAVSGAFLLGVLVNVVWLWFAAAMAVTPVRCRRPRPPAEGR
ncbi:phosphatase PAP2 family protein [Propionicicella superfundia]|uniref:phosphatase PAP2 family protein n=1 Tax=Propionicicella superfundia TaxID=348582 RepID=UPI00040EEE2C|nr:phosphatase PAP2 family protein [Propionicicella superfundia]